mmetsp:Transcript_118213/g.307015  ORF Transcript_118213/g.307015 Transcript_118213/m.307015 type:complete len:331 (-) Transcript_118213:818-1810(-)
MESMRPWLKHHLVARASGQTPSSLQLALLPPTWQQPRPLPQCRQHCSMEPMRQWLRHLQLLPPTRSSSRMLPTEGVPQAVRLAWFPLQGPQMPQLPQLLAQLQAWVLKKLLRAEQRPQAKAWVRTHVQLQASAVRLLRLLQNTIRDRTQVPRRLPEQTLMSSGLSSAPLQLLQVAVRLWVLAQAHGRTPASRRLAQAQLQAWASLLLQVQRQVPARKCLRCQLPQRPEPVWLALPSRVLPLKRPPAAAERKISKCHPRLPAVLLRAAAMPSAPLVPVPLPLALLTLVPSALMLPALVLPTMVLSVLALPGLALLALAPPAVSQTPLRLPN